MDHNATKGAEALPAKLPPPSFLPECVALPSGQPIIIRKSRGYKGILLVMLAVFIMALFVLMISEIYYNRQLDEKFFRHRWAELKHRADQRDFRRDRLMGSLTRNREGEIGARPTTPAETSSSAEPPLSDLESSGRSFGKQELQTDNPPVQSTHLQLLKKILTKIKEHMEDMGFDGTMQVSVLAVRPQVEESQPPPRLDSSFPRRMSYSSFMDGFGEVHQPAFAQQTNQPVDGDEPVHVDQPILFGEPHNSLREDERLSVAAQLGSQIGRNPFMRPEVTAVWSPAVWQILSQQQQPMAFIQPPPSSLSQLEATQKHLQPSILPRPLFHTMFDRWSQLSSEDGSEMANQQQQAEKSNSEQSGSTPSPATPNREEMLAKRIQTSIESIMQQQPQFPVEPGTFLDSEFLSMPSMLVPIQPQHMSSQGSEFGVFDKASRLSTPALFPLQNQRVLEGEEFRVSPLLKAPEDNIQIEPPTPNQVFEPAESAPVRSESAPSSSSNNVNWPLEDLSTVPAHSKGEEKKEVDEETSVGREQSQTTESKTDATHRAQGDSDESHPAQNKWLTGPPHFTVESSPSQSLESSPTMRAETILNSKPSENFPVGRDEETSDSASTTDAQPPRKDSANGPFLFFQVDKP